jgi:glycosyltransferase involved in cell wall biosynthesis
MNTEGANDDRTAAGMSFVSVVIPHYNDLAALAECVRLLDSQTYPRAGFEIIVADNNSACGMDAVRSAAPDAIVVPAPIQGAGPARNAGVAASRGDILAFIDSDCRPDRDWLRQGVASLGRFDFSGGKVLVSSQDPERPSGVEAFEMVFAFDFKRYIEKVGFTGTGNMFVPRRIFDTVGPFRSGLSEDMEWSFRARKLGFKLGFAPDAIVRHPARRDWLELKKRWARMVQEQYLLAREQPYGRLRWAAAALAMPASILPHAWRLLRTDRLGRLRDRLTSMSVLIRLRLWRAGAMFRQLTNELG